MMWWDLDIFFFVGSSASKPRKQLRADYALRLERSDGMERELSIDINRRWGVIGTQMRKTGLEYPLRN